MYGVSVGHPAQGEEELTALNSPPLQEGRHDSAPWRPSSRLSGKVDEPAHWC